MFPAKYRVGATATLKRQDGLDKVFHYHLGHNIVRPKKSEQPIPKIAVYSYTRSSGYIPNYLKEIITRRGSLLSMLARNEERTAVIAHLGNELISSGRQTLIVSERTTHLKKLRELFIHEYKYDPSKVGLYIGSTSKKERERVATECKCILATTSMLSLGTDIPTLRGLVFGTPLSQVAQPVGRIRRLCENSSFPLVVDIVDHAYPETERWYRGRRKFYDSIGCEVHHITS